MQIYLGGAPCAGCFFARLAAHHAWVAARGGSRSGNRKGAVDEMRRANQAASESCAETDAENMPQKAACTFIVN
ncbi:hypothetical protein HMPREF9098_2443 [Kingella denitrificans ATCC 33394]|uniref:Uncharacterized protein n=1 Tax=Kingella denitrificans ATCC 33394 TaxID=888741 RepID=F0F2V8_9NEIS|nr:hypothetical protein [Kingella denitrificans]EGC16120.1 hypothetical protein HMPREF9098_2443 [Kingella denitrificans ATCC 33394]